MSFFLYCDVRLSETASEMNVAPQTINRYAEDSLKALRFISVVCNVFTLLS